MADCDVVSARYQSQLCDAEFFVLFHNKPRPNRIKAPFARLAGMRDFAQQYLKRADNHFLIVASGAKTGSKGKIEEQYIEPIEARYRPKAQKNEGDARKCAGARHKRHYEPETAKLERAVGPEHGLEQRSIGRVHHAVARCCLPVAIKRSYIVAIMTTKPLPVIKPLRRKAAAPKPLSKADIAEVFRRFAAIDPEPKGELEHVNPFTLLVAVVLSAQATDAGVNKATRALFKIADTPEKMLALGEDRVREHIKTIGLFRTKAKNVMALSEALISHHGSVVPEDREALQALPGVGRKTANVVLNMAFGWHTMAVDTHVFRVSNRIPLAIGKTPEAVEKGLEAVIPKDFALHAHHWLILHGRYVCKARKPECWRCPVAELCRFEPKTAPPGK